jgi:hypothetical protein
LAGAQVVIEDGDIDGIEVLHRFLDGGGWETLVAVLAEDGGAEVEIVDFVVEEEDPDVPLAVGGCGTGWDGDLVGWLAHEVPFIFITLWSPRTWLF